MARGKVIHRERKQERKIEDKCKYYSSCDVRLESIKTSVFYFVQTNQTG